MNKIKLNLKLFLRAIHLVYSVSPKSLIYLLIAITLQGLMPSLSLLITSEIINHVANGNLNASDLIFYCLIWSGSLLLANLLQPTVLMLQSNISDLTVNKVNLDIITKANSISTLSEFETPKLHNDIQVLQTQANHKPLNLVVTLVGIIRDFIVILSCFIIMFKLIPWIGIVVIFGLLLNYKIIAFIQEKFWTESLGRSHDSRRLSYLTKVALGSSYAKEVRLFNLGPYLLSEYKNIFYQIFIRSKSLRLKLVFWSLFPLLFSAVANLTAFYKVVVMTSKGIIPIGSIPLFLQGLANLHFHLNSFSEQVGWLHGHLNFFRMYFEFLDFNSLKLSTSQDLKIEFIFNKPLNLENVSYSYPNNHLALNNINLVIKPGDKIALVGKNGSGKSTLIKIICALYLPTTGNIYLGSEKICNANLNNWQQNISPVFQDFNMFSFSIPRNIAMSEEIDYSKLSDLLDQLHMTNFTSKQDDFFSAVVGPEFSNSNLSQGQWQKVAIARAFYKDSPLIILDEPTSSLDPFAEAEIYDIFTKLARNKTVIYSTHRLNSVTSADRIVLIDNGEIIAEGSHSYLMHNCPLYKEMFISQAKHYQEQYC